MITYSSAVLNARVEPGNAATPSTPLKVVSSNITFDRTWSPHIQGTLVVPLMSAADSLACDPRQGLAVKFTLSSTFNGVTTTQDFLTWLRRRTSDFNAGTTTLGFASIESLMQDAAIANARSNTAATDDVTEVTTALNAMRWTFTSGAYPITGLATVDGTAAKSIAIGDASWSSGTSAWDAAQGIEEAQQLWLHGDETGLTLLRSAPMYSADTNVHAMADTDRIINVVDEVDRDNPDWANVVLITYQNGTAGQFDASTPPTIPWKFYVTSSNRKTVPNPSQAVPRAARMKARGRNLTITAIADLATRPNRAYQVSYQGYVWTGIVQAVTFRDGLMDVTLNIIE